MATGLMTLDGWNDYACKSRLLGIFCDEFWAVSGVDGESLREGVPATAKAAGRIGAVLRVAFWRNTDRSTFGKS